MERQHPRSPFAVSMTAQPTYRLGDPILVTFKIENSTSETYQVLKWGTPLEGDFTVDSKVLKLTAGSLLAIPPDVEHFIKVVGRETCLDLDIFIPRREDYIQSKIKEETLQAEKIASGGEIISELTGRMDIHGNFEE